jgi:glucokinase
MHANQTAVVVPPGNGRAGFLLAIDFGGTKIAMATTSTEGDRLHEAQISTLAEQGADQVIRRMFEAARVLLANTVASYGGALLGVAAVTPGIVEPGGIKLAPNNPGWELLALGDVLSEGFGIDNVVVETDVKAAALAEARCGALAGVSCGLYLNLGTGLAAAAVIDGKVLRGANGAAGEIGYQLRGVPGEMPFASGGAPLEQFVSGRAIADRVSVLAGYALSARDAFTLAATEPRVARLIDDAFDVLGVHIANLVLMLDPARIAIGGGMARIDGLTGRLTACLQRAVPYPPEVVIASFRHEAALQGAIITAVDACRSELRRVELDALPVG